MVFQVYHLNSGTSKHTLVLKDLICCNFRFQPCFLVGAFPLREKCPTIAVTVFSRRFSREKCPTLTVSSFFFFFLFFSVDNLTLSGPLFLQFCNSAQKANFTPKGPPFSFYFFKETYTTGRAQRVPPLDFFRHCPTFFRKFLKFIKGYPLAFFLKFSVCRKR